MTGVRDLVLRDLAELAEDLEEADTPQAARSALAYGLHVVQERLCDLDVSLAVAEMLDHPDVPERTWRLATIADHVAQAQDVTAPLATARVQLTRLYDETGALLDQDPLPLSRWSPAGITPPRVTQTPWVVIADEHRDGPTDPATRVRDLAARLAGT